MRLGLEQCVSALSANYGLQLFFSATCGIREGLPCGGVGVGGWVRGGVGRGFIPWNRCSTIRAINKLCMRIIPGRSLLANVCAFKQHHGKVTTEEHTML